MFNVKISLFSGTRELENKIDEMHDKIIESSLYFKEAFEIYIKEKRSHAQGEKDAKLRRRTKQHHFGIGQQRSKINHRTNSNKEQQRHGL